MRGIAGDIRFGMRLLARRPGLTAPAVLALALGIGGTTAIFSVVYAVLLRPLPFPDADRLVMLWEKNPPRSRNFVSPANFLDWQEQARSFRGMAALRDVRLNMAGGQGAPEEVRAQRVSADLFALLGVQAALGRTFREHENGPGAAPVVVLGHGFWKRRFGGDAAVLGRSLRLNGRAHTIIGVLPPEFGVRSRLAELWVPLALNPSEDYRATGGRTLSVLARLRPGATVDGAAAEMEDIARGLERAHPEFNAGWRVTVISLREELVGEVRPALLALLAGTGILLLMSCTNVASLLLSRAAGRQREIAVRAALGAPRRRIVRQLLVETALLALAGGAAGLALALWSTGLLAALSPAEIPRVREAGLDPGLLLFTLAVSLAAAALAGLAPALEMAAGNLSAALREGGRGQVAGRRRRIAQRGLVVAEVALATVLLIGAGLSVRSFLRVRSLDRGLDAADVLTLNLSLAGGRNDTPPRRVAFFEEVLRRVEALPGVVATGAVSLLPLDGFGAGVTFSVPGQPAPAAGERAAALMRVTAGDYFRALRIPLLEGRAFAPQDTAEAPRVVVVNQNLARRFFAPGRAVGSRLVLDLRPPVTAEIVGVVGDVKADRLNAEIWPTIYGPHAQMPAPRLSLAVRTVGDAWRLEPAVVSAISSLDREQPVAEVRTLEQIVSHSLAADRYYAVLLALFAAVALVLASVGVYGVVAYQVTERTHEIGVRLGLGATPGRVLGLVLREGALLALAGAAIGVAAALPLARVAPALLFGASATDPAAFGAAPLLLAAVALLAAWLPARRAAHLDPAACLRHE